jgi:osmotically-inducible protein OsmY
VRTTTLLSLRNLSAPSRHETKAALADKLVEAQINSALIEHISRTDAPVGITVSVADGKVTLAGTSANGSVHNRAGEVARGIAGVREIDNRITSVASYGGGLLS